MHRFFVDPSQVEGNVIRIGGGDVNHIKNVLRLRRGDEITLVCGDGLEYRCALEAADAREILARIVDVTSGAGELPCRITLFQGLPKSDKMEFVIQKAVELGASEIVPVATERSVVRLDEKKAEKKAARWQQIAESAAKQSGRMRVPAVHPVVSFPEALRFAESCDVRLIPYELAEGMNSSRALIGSIRPGQSVAVFIGPEGGFSREEIRAAMEAGVHPMTLGRRILRTETAGLAALSILMFHLEED